MSDFVVNTPTRICCGLTANECTCADVDVLPVPSVIVTNETGRVDDDSPLPLPVIEFLDLSGR